MDTYDGLQLEFFDRPASRYIGLQVMALASDLAFYRLDRV